MNRAIPFDDKKLFEIWNECFSPASFFSGYVFMTLKSVSHSPSFAAAA